MAWIESYRTKKGIMFRVGYRVDNKIFRIALPPGSSKSDAKAKKAEIEHKELSIKHNYTKLKIEDLYEWFTKTTKSKMLAKQYLRRINLSTRLFAEMFPGKDIGELTEDDIRHFKEKRLEQVAPETVNIDIVHFRVVINTAYVERIINYNPFDREKLIRLPKKTPHFFTDEELDKIEQTLIDTRQFSGDEKALMAFYLFRYGAIRRKSCEMLRWRDVKWDENDIILRAEYIKKRKEKIIPVPPKLIAILREYKEKHNLADNNLIVGLNESTISHYIRRAIIAAGLGDKKGSTHIFRHSRGKKLADNDVDLDDIATILGQDTLAMAHYYSQLSNKAVHKKIDNLDD